MALLPAALYLMLDSSGSMAELASGTTSKWAAIQRAVRGFLTETRDGDLLLGVQFFPILKAGTKYNCTTEEDCGLYGGPCFLKTCLQGSSIQLCRSNDDCEGGPDVNPCISFGLCDGSDPTAPVACVLEGMPVCANGQGRCADFERTCTNATSCDSTVYAAPAVEIGAVASVQSAIDQAISQRLPQGLTPTVPALQGALEHARAWSSSHPGQSVAVVLATDGLPTQCGGEQSAVSDGAINQVLSTASASAADVPTYVIGVFTPGDTVSASNIDAIAQAGGTERAVHIDANGQVEQQFLDALRSVRTAASGCVIELQGAQPLDFSHAELQFDSGGGNPSPVPYVEDLLGCTAHPEGWYYDTPPAQGRPSRVELCPDLCQLVRAAPPTGLQLQIACASP